ncbi:MAG: hypothetical protein ACLGHA_03050 [Gammaproteobacteria bacterium]
MTASESTRFPVWLGLAQGIALYVLYRTLHDAAWPPESGWLFNGVLLCTLLLPFAAYWSQDVLATSARRKLLLVLAGLVFGLGAYQAATVYPQLEATRLQLAPAPAFFGLALLVFMAVPLASGWARGEPGDTWGRWNYSRLFEHAWRNTVVTIQAGVLTALFWILVLLGAQLFNLIGVEWPWELIREKWFAIPVTTFAIALGMRGGLRRSAFTVSLRNHWLTLTVWLLPLASLIGAAFVLTSLAGVGSLFDRGLSAFVLLWFAAFWIKFFNSAYQDGQTAPALHPLLRRVLPATAPALLAVIGLASWALFVRIGQYGLTPDRIWGVLVVGVALTYGAGYSLSAWRGGASRWMPTMGSTNIAAALVMCIGIVLLLSPALDPNRLATANQIARLDTGRVSADEFDVHALTRQGRAGHDALVALRGRPGADGRPGKLAVRADEAFSQRRYARQRDQPESQQQVADPADRIESLPAGKALPAGFSGFLKQDIAGWESWERTRSCFALHQTQPKCVLLQVDLDRDGRDEVVLWDTPSSAQSRVYAYRQNAWQRIGRLVPERGLSNSVRADVATGDYAVQPSRWDALRVGAGRFQVFEKAE